MTICTYEIENSAFKGLPFINDICELSSSQESIVDKLGEVLVKYSLEKAFYICRLHHHFNVFEDEIIIATLEDETNDEIVTVAKRQDMIGKTEATAWRFSHDETKLVPIQYRHSNNPADFIPDLECAIKEIQKILIQHSALNTFGICLSDDDELQAGLAKVENTDTESRIQWFEQLEVTELDKVIQTNWSFLRTNELGDSARNMAKVCRSYCKTPFDGGHWGDHRKVKV